MPASTGWTRCTHCGLLRLADFIKSGAYEYVADYNGSFGRLDSDPADNNFVTIDYEECDEHVIRKLLAR